MLFNVLDGKVNPHVLMWGTVLVMLAIAYAVNAWVEKRHAKALRALLERALARRKGYLGTAVTCAADTGPAALPQDERIYVTTDAIAPSESCDPHGGIMPLNV